MGLENYILTCEKDNKELRYDLSYYKSYSKRLKEKNEKYKKVIDKAIKLVNDPWYLESRNEKVDEITVQKKKELLAILKEVE